ncbi:hypothetical protein P5G50_18225 [Leifsonia sp. F6_8S_P_1B]|uniref:HicB family toxin-antitoxin system n=1 Tax=Leifsonia williamsii TaxID=3035919 RepID=A0ABT8KFZ7_9MICO|nr:hypothetical protein [Leifsonia williamsii]MDN4616388.1 hypothetical protein [Leifsonia williamsii]
MNTYKATITREGKWWMVAIPEIDGLTQARRLSEAPLMAREYISAATDQPLDEVEVTASVERVGDLVNISDALNDIRSSRAAAAVLEDHATVVATWLAQSLAAQNVTVRDIGTILGVSYQRAQQLTASASADPEVSGLGAALVGALIAEVGTHTAGQSRLMDRLANAGEITVLGGSESKASAY